MSVRNRSRLVVFMLAAVYIFFVAIAFVDARAGGSGGRSSSSSSRSSSSSSRSSSSSGSYSGSTYSTTTYSSNSLGNLFFLSWIFSTPGIVTIVIVGTVIFVIYSRSKRRAGNAYANLGGAGFGKGLVAFKKRNPGFDQAAFEAKARTAFLGIQEAWSQQNLAGVRRFISDGVYQRFNTQFKMMRLLKQTNRLSNISIKNLSIDTAEREGPYDILTVAIEASMTDKFVCELDHSLDESGSDAFIEFWSFIRKGRPDTGEAADPFKDIFHNNNCPSCGAPLPEDLGERGSCPYCNALVNSGDYDWVLSEITQADDFAADRAIERSSNLGSRIQALGKIDKNFSAQLMEDKASNAYLQILTAIAHRDPSIMRRFTTDEAFGSIQAAISSDPVVYNRLFLNQVTLIGAELSEKRNRLIFSIGVTSQKVLLEKNSIDLLDPVLVREDVVLTMSRQAQAQETKGNLLLHQCAACGAPVQDSLDVKCPYCGTAFNAGSHEWVVESLMDLDEYSTEFYADTKGDLDMGVNPAIFDRVYDVRDYVLNNFMVIVAADGVFADEERAMAEQLARKLRFNPADLGPLFDQARSGRLGIRMPADVTKRQKIVDILEEAAAVDGEIGEAEEKILDHIRRSYIIEDDE